MRFLTSRIGTRRLGAWYSIEHFLQNIIFTRYPVLLHCCVRLKLGITSLDTNIISILEYLHFHHHTSATWQVEIRECGADSAVGVGLADKTHDPSKFPGWKKRSCGYHSDDGILFKKGQHNKGTWVTSQGVGITQFYNRSHFDWNKWNARSSKFTLSARRARTSLSRGYWILQQYVIMIPMDVSAS